MIRAAAKNHDAVAVVTDPSQYAAVLDELERGGGVLARETCARLAGEAFQRTSRYDAAIARYLGGGLCPPSSSEGASTAPSETSPRSGAGQAGARTEDHPVVLDLRGERVLALKYGENPHQSAAFYTIDGGPVVGLAAMKPLHGPELGYNNLLDFSAALALLLEFEDPAAVVIKHTNPCGAALGRTVGEAMTKAKASDPVSIYGGIVGVNRPLDMAVVEALAGIFVEILFAPAFEPDALEELRRTKKKCRVFEVPCDRGALPRRLPEYRSVLGGLLAQSTDLDDVDANALKTVSKRAPTADELRALRFAWRVGKHAKSNAIVLTTADQVIGVGAGQMNRVDSARLAVMRARAQGLETRGTVCASDAFFPFRDGLDVVAEAGATAVMHPGGSLRDDEVIAAADAHGMAVVLTGIRHFRH
jgi:phosphoribosylaminoimidazolecarboxamide formyltransferase/IMP cyclohydrolase